MKIKNTNVQIWFEHIENIQVEILNNQHEFTQYFCPPSMPSVSETAPPEMPRMFFQSIGGHSQITFSKISACLNTNYDGNYDENFQKCIENIKEKISCIFNFLQTQNAKLSYIGLSTTLQLEEKGENLVQTLSSKMNKLTSNIDLYDYSNRLAFVVENDYFVNITFANMREYHAFNLQPNSIARLIPDETKQDIEVFIDINDKRAFLFNNEYYSCPKKFEKLIDLSAYIVKNAKNIFDNGEINFYG